MKQSLRLLIGFICVFFTTSAFAIDPVEPSVSNNVHVLKNISPSQCPGSWNGSAGTADITADTGAGVSNTQEDAGVRSCSSCQYDSASHDCVCATCYDYFN